MSEPTGMGQEFEGLVAAGGGGAARLGLAADRERHG